MTLHPGARKVALLYAAFSAAWIVASDWLFTRLFPATFDHRLVSTTKGLVFILVTAAFIYETVRRASVPVERERDWFTDLFVGSADAVLVVGNDGTFAAVNDVAVERYGYTRDELLRRGPEDLSVRELREAFADRLAEALADGSRFEWRHATRDGEELVVDVSARPVRRNGDRAVLLTVRDITGFKHALETLRRSEEEQRALISCSPLALYSIDPDGRVLTWNPSAERLTGWTAAEVLGRPLPVVPPEMQEEFAANRRRVLAGESLSGVLVERRRKDGTMFTGRIFTAPVRDADGRVVAIMAAHEDVTDQLRAERALAESEARLARMLDHLPGMAYRCRDDEGWTMLRVSAGAEPLTGWAPGDFTSQAVTYASLIHADDRVRVRRAVDEALAGRRDFVLEYRIVARDGAEKWVWERGGAAADPAGGEDGVLVGFIMDVSDRRRAEAALRESERRFRHAVADAPVPMFIHADDGEILVVSRAVTELTGYEGHELPTVASWSDLAYGPDEAERVRHAVARTHRGMPRGEQREYEVRCRDGSRRVWVFSSTPLGRMSDGRHLAFSVGADITDLRRAERERESVQQQLFRAQRMEAVGQLAGGVAHDFNNILQAVMGYARLLLDTAPSPEMLREGLEEIHGGAERAAALTRQLLTFSRRQVMQPAALDLDAVVEDMLRMVRRVIGEHVRLEWLPASGLGTVRADRGMLEQVLMNLCVNARDAMPGGGTLTVETLHAHLDASFCRTRPWARPGDFVMLGVADTGVGMEAAVLDRLFEPFFTTKGEQGGTGLGLATVYGIVQQHAGLIDVASEPGRGTRFRVYLPRVAAPAAAPERAGGVPATGGRETILLAEDDEGVRRLAARVLQAAGYTVVEAADGRQAVEAFARRGQDLDLAIMDVVMPRMSGRDAARVMEDERPGLPVLYTSGYSDGAVHKDFVLDGGLTLLQKPYAPEVLLKAVRERLDEAR